MESIEIVKSTVSTEVQPLVRMKIHYVQCLFLHVYTYVFCCLYETQQRYTNVVVYKCRKIVV